MSTSKSDSYAAAGVDVTAGYTAVEKIKPLVESTYNEGVLGTLGGFGGLYAPDFSGMRRPVMVSGADGVGTKLKIAFMMDRHNTIGIDCVAMCVNDIACSGAAPMFFLDYLAVGKTDPAKIEKIVSGIAAGCRMAGCALIGGETAEMPGFYPENEYDLAGFSVGLVDQDKIIDGSEIRSGDMLLGLSSSGLHSNGFSLVRKVLDVNAENLQEYVPELGCRLGDELLKPTRIYVKPILHLIRNTGIQIKGVCHITGGGLYENIPRMLPEGVVARVCPNKFPTMPIFNIIQEKGDIPSRDMYNTFNMGIGLVLAVDEKDVGSAIEALIYAGEQPYVIGRCAKGKKGVELKW